MTTRSQKAALVGASIGGILGALFGGLTVGLLALLTIFIYQEMGGLSNTTTYIALIVVLVGASTGAGLGGYFLGKKFAKDFFSDSKYLTRS